MYKYEYHGRNKQAMNAIRDANKNILVIFLAKTISCTFVFLLWKTSIFINK